MSSYNNNIIGNVKKAFKNKYYCEELRKKDENRELIKCFSGGKLGVGVERFLKEKAWVASESGASKVFLVKEKNTEIIKAYFSLKCGLLYSPYISSRIEGEDRDFFEMILEAMRNDDQDLLTEYEGSDLYSDDVFKKFYREAERIVEYERKKRKESLENILDVAVTYPAIEIENLCKNFANQTDNKDAIPFGFLVFWIFVVPIIRDITTKIGCEYVYIYAADQSNKRDSNKTDAPGKVETQALVAHYRTNFGFHDADELFFVRPQYDYECYEMVQSIKELADNSANIWKRYEDILIDAADIADIIP